MAAGLGAYERPVPASVAVTHQLIEYLRSGAILPGNRIPSERALAETLNVGRTTVREAVTSLVLLGILDARLGDGTYLVNSTSDLLVQLVGWGLMLGEQSITDLVEARAHLELDLVALAATRRTPEQLARLEGIVKEMTAASADLDAYIDADIRFHLAVAEASGNNVLINMYQSVRSLLQVWSSRVIQRAGSTETSLALHVPIFEAIRAEDARAAQIAMTEHMETATRHLFETISEPTAEPEPGQRESLAELESDRA